MSWFQAATIVLLIAIRFGQSSGHPLSSTFYGKRCANLSSTVRGVVEQARKNHSRLGARLLRVHFHDCFVNGCDGSLLLDDADSMLSEKGALANRFILLDIYEVVDDIKTAVERVCPGVVSCADILAIAAQISVAMDGGPTWQVQLGRRDGRIANYTGTTVIPNAFETLSQISEKFTDQGLDTTDLVALSGAHSFGAAGCAVFRHRLYNYSNTGRPDPSLDPTYLQTLRQRCPRDGLAIFFALDPTTPDRFDNNYFINLQNHRGLLQTDQFLFSTPGSDTVDIVKCFANSQSDFFEAFGKSMIKMGNIRPLTGSNGEIRSNCRRVN